MRCQGRCVPQMKSWLGSTWSDVRLEWLCGKLGDLNQWANQRGRLLLPQGARKMKHTCPVITPNKLHTWQHEPRKDPGLVPSSVPCPHSLSGRPFPFR